MDAMETRTPAGFFTRAGAAVADGLILFPFFYVLVKLAIALAGGRETLAADPAKERIFLRIVESVLMLASASYYTSFTANGGRTPGKRLAGIRVLGQDGAPVGWGRSFARWAASQLSALLLGLGFAVAAVEPRTRALHDFIAGTVVVSEETPRLRRGLVAAAGAIATALVAAVGLALISDYVCGGR